mgnify:CR=1 FL=1
MKVLILGSGMYVTGKNYSKSGTILSSVLQSSKLVPIEEVVVISYSQSSEEHTLRSVAYTCQKVGVQIPVSFEYLSNKRDNWFQHYLIEEKFDLCINSLPDHLHFVYTKYMLTSRIPTLVVKPLTPKYSEAKELVDIAKSEGTYCAVEFHKRWDESNLYLKNEILTGNLGEMLYFTVNYSQRISIPTEHFKTWADKTNIFQYLGIHYVDLIYFLTGKMPKCISVYGTMKKLKSMGIDTYDSVHVSSLWGDVESESNDFYAHFNLNWIDPNSTSAMSDQKLMLVGTEGRVSLDQKDRGIETVTNKNGIQTVNPYFASWLPNMDGTTSFGGYGYKSIFTFLDDVNNLINGLTTTEALNKTRPSAESSLISTRFIDLVTSNLKSGNTNRTEL